jgi:hypothetical protein
MAAIGEAMSGHTFDNLLGFIRLVSKGGYVLGENHSRLNFAHEDVDFVEELGENMTRCR